MGLEGESGATDSCLRATSPAPLMCLLWPVGGQWGAPGLRAEQPLVPGWGHQLGHGLWPEKQAWGVHQSGRTPALDLQQDGGESPVWAWDRAGRGHRGGVPGRGPRPSAGSWQRSPHPSGLGVCRSAEERDRAGSSHQANPGCLFPFPSSEQGSGGWGRVVLGQCSPSTKAIPWRWPRRGFTRACVGGLSSWAGSWSPGIWKSGTGDSAPHLLTQSAPPFPGPDVLALRQKRCAHPSLPVGCRQSRGESSDGTRRGCRNPV